MNTVILLAKSRLTHTAFETNIEGVSVAFRSSLERLIASDKGIALIQQPGSLHASGEVYLYNGGLVSVTSQGELRKESDLLLPRRDEELLRQYHRDGWVTYFIRVPAIGNGSVRLEMNAQFVPILAQIRTGSKKPASVQQKQKHVS
jgi:hypothetical protein